MKFFISYCQKDGEGLQYARRAKEACRQRNIDTWVWADDSSGAEWLITDIANNIESSNAMFTIVTSGTEQSKPQKQEWSFTGSSNKINVSAAFSLSCIAFYRKRRGGRYGSSIPGMNSLLRGELDIQ